MDYEKLSTSILAAIENRPGDIGAYEDLFSLCQAWAETDFAAAHRANKKLKDMCDRMMDKVPMSQVEGFYSLWRRGLLFEAPYDFDSYLTYIELDRKLEKRFYQPRKHYLKRYVDAYQKILDGELDFLSISMPKRAGKSQLGINFTNMLSGKFPEKATLMEGTGDDLVNSFYKGCLEYLQTPSEYLFYDVFPESKLVQTNADTKTLNLMNKSRFPTIMCRSIDARQVGLSEATNLLYLDDCVEGREEAKNRQRLDEKWEVISGDIIGRAIEGTPIVICGTRYSLYDPIGRLQEEMKKQNKRCKIIETPALDLVTDESNFEYIRDGKKVFTTQYFRDQRDMLSAEQFESEFQQQPFEAKGLLFPEGNLNRFFELPVDKEPDTIIAACDTADKGADYCAMPIAAVYGQEVYIIDVVFDDSTPEVTKPEVAKALINNKVVSAMFESNNAGSYFARDVQDILKSREYMCSIRTKRTISNKQTRIEFASDNILKHFYFKHPSTYARNSQYAEFMRQVTTYTRSGKVAHDDGADSLSLLENELRGLVGTKVEVFARPF
jgi:predicted phage terminase large subunit-like protein